MSFVAKLQRAREVLEQQGRLSIRALGRELELGGAALDELIEELVDVQGVARRDENVLVWSGQSSPSTARASPTPPETRKVITVIFADLMGSTALQERLDPESINRVMDAYYQAVRGPVEAAGGTVVQLLGDGVLCAFGIPRIAEDDAPRAVRAAMGIQHAFREFVQAQQWLNVSIGLRVAVNTGEVVVSEDHPAGIGDPLNVAARLQQEARDGEVLIGQATRRLVADAVTLEQAGVFALKGRSETVTAYRVLSLERPTGATAAAFVGRDEELARISAVYDAALTKPAARLAVLLGSPGVGKSRLMGEVSRRFAGSTTIFFAHCDAAGGATFEPVAEALRQWLRQAGSEAAGGPPAAADLLEAAVPDGEADRVRIINGVGALLAGSPASPEETFFVIRRFFTALAHARPVILAIDDLHWAGLLLLDLVEHLIQWGGGVPLFVLVGARPELRDLRSSLVTPGGVVSEVVTLGGLDAGAAMRLAANVIGAADLPAAVAGKVLATTEGNPLFVGELARMLVDEGAIARRGDRWVVGANLAALEMPPTIHALLAARIERLRPEERTVLERASVAGRHFSRGAVAALSSQSGSELDARLEALRRTELIERDAGWFLGEPMMRFHHVLIRDAAYRRLLKGTRASLHTQLADWIEARVKDAPEHDETIGWHLEQSHQLLGELGPLDAKGKALGERAARRLAAAGRRALARDDVPVAAGLLGRAIERLDAVDPARAELAVDWCEALLAAGDVGPAARAIDELGRFAGEGSRLRAWHTCFAAQHTVLTAPQSLQAAADAASDAAQELTALADSAGEAKAHFVHALALARLGKFGGCEAALDRALAAARRADDRRRANTVLAIAPLAALWGPSPVTRASGRCLDVVRVLRITQGAPAVEAVALSCQAVLEALRGRTEAARRMIASSRKMVEDLGIRQRLLEADAFGGLIDLLEGDAAAAERSLRGAYDGLRDLGLGIDAARAAALLARALLAQSRVAEAEAMSHESELLAGDDLKAAIAWRGVRAEALAQRGLHAEAVELAQAAVGIASTTDALLDHADARRALAVALRAALRRTEADAEERHANDLWQIKGATLLAGRARAGGRRSDPTQRADQPRIAPAMPAQRRVRANAATAAVAAGDAMLATCDLASIPPLFAEGYEEIDHPTGSTYGKREAVASVGRSLRSHDASYRVEPLATLGDRLALCRRRVHARATGRGRFDVGEYETETIVVMEVDEHGLYRRLEVFAANHLRDAIVGFYARHAELSSEGPERERARAMARSVAAWNGLIDADRLAAVMAASVECVDHRSLHTWSARGAEEFLGHWRAQIDLATGYGVRDDDVLAVEPDRLLVRQTYYGKARETGGSFENPVLVLFVSGASGLLTRAEVFEPDREADALARFDELAARIQPQPTVRRVRTNAAAASIARFEAAFAAGDDGALDAEFDASLVVLAHPTGVSYGRQGHLESVRRLARSRDPELHFELLATLGDALVLTRRRVAASGTGGKRYDVGAYERVELVLSEVGPGGRTERIEIFADDRLGEATVRLYQRYAELLPDIPLPGRSRAQAGQERERAAAITASVAVIAERFDIDRLAAAIAPDIQVTDRRNVGFGAVYGGEALVAAVRALLDLSEGFDWRIDDVFALRADALVVRQTSSGLDRRGGGAFERSLCELFVLGADGRIARWERFDLEHADESLARFDELDGRGAECVTGRFENAATRLNERFMRAWAARDWNAIKGLHGSAHHYDDRRRLMQVQASSDTSMDQLRVLFEVPRSRWTMTPIATRGERLSLSRYVFEGDVDAGGGRLGIEYLTIDEAADDGHYGAVVLFDLDDLDAAYAELEARYEAAEGAAFPSHGTFLRAYVRAIASRDWDPVIALMSGPTFVEHDHRRLAVLGTTRGAEAWARNFHTLTQLAPDTVYRVDHFRSCARGFWCVGTWHGTREGGRYEIPVTAVIEMDQDDRVARADIYDEDQLGQAQARFVELAGRTAIQSRVVGAATRARERVDAVFMAEDWDALRALAAEAMVFEDRRHAAMISGDAELWIKSIQTVRTASNVELRDEVIATAGERIELRHRLLTGIGPDGGDAFESEFLLLTEIDADGRIAASINFEVEQRDEALHEVQRRFDDVERLVAHPPFADPFANAASATAGPVVASMTAHDWEEFARHFADDFHISDRRRVVQLELDKAQYVAFTREVADGRTLGGESHAIATRGERLALMRSRFEFTDTDVGPSEIAFLLVTQVDARGRIEAYVRFDLDDEKAARAELDRRFDAGEGALYEGPSASAYARAFTTRDWDAIAAMCAQTFVEHDHRRIALLGTREGGQAWARTEGALVELAPDTIVRFDHVRVAPHGVLSHLTFHGSRDGSRFEIPFVSVMEVDAQGKFARSDVYDPETIEAALARFAELSRDAADRPPP